MASNDHDLNDDDDNDHPNPNPPAPAPPRKPDRPADRDRSARDEPAAPPEPTADEIKAELDRTRRALAAANKSDKERRLRLDELERAEEERRNATLGETEKLTRAKTDAERRAADAQRLADDRERQLEEIKLERLVEAEARKQNFESPELVFKLIDRKTVEHDADMDRWEGISKSVEFLARSYPNLLKQKKAGPGSPPRDEHPGNTRRAGRLSGRSGNEEVDPFAAYTNERISYERM